MQSVKRTNKILFLSYISCQSLMNADNSNKTLRLEMDPVIIKIILEVKAV